MRSFIITATGLLACASSAYATNYIIKDYCTEKVYLYFADSSATTGPFELDSGEAFTQKITGSGHSIGVVNNTSDYWSATGPKCILGVTANETEAELYWTISTVDGDCLQGKSFSVTSEGRVPDVCGTTTSYDGEVHACADDGNVTLTWNLC
ncbi:hypothetical protein LTR36_008874 [Oleoguttula mirabilis]|uniref:Uncharacterized protein n=1 Tax=Oleoguttula mirabilis TaxID=1507867 RepID=A0AAV9J7P6_9PEZI|nr:hypothetical protein LTR36_008874 [Oleoguttula mirabilis]